MGKIKTLELSAAQQAALEKGYRTGESHAFRVRCQIIRLKGERRTSAEIAEIVDCCEMVVNNGLKRFAASEPRGAVVAQPQIPMVGALRLCHDGGIVLSGQTSTGGRWQRGDDSVL
ncbi:MAG: hypothetical protein ACRERD_09940 [Candidatus Binatia bacterium]